MTRDVFVQTVVAIHSYSLNIWAGEVIIPYKREFVTRVDRDPVPDVMPREDVATRPEESVYRVAVRGDVVGDRHPVSVSRHVYPRPSNTPYLQMWVFCFRSWGLT